MDAMLGDDVLAVFGVCAVAPLGGRLNQHWLVERRHIQLVLRRWYQPSDSIAYEVQLMARLATLGWPVALVVDGPVEVGGATWSLSPHLVGDPPSTTDALAEQRARGRLLAAFHHDLAAITDLGQRDPWRRCEEILSDPSLDAALALREATRAEEVRVLRWHLERARERLAQIGGHAWPGQVVHGDFTAWNLRFRDGRLSGILDFEAAHLDHRVADFMLSWRGVYDAVIAGYQEVTPLEPHEWALLTPCWWASLLEGACEYLRDDTRDDGWIMKMLLRRSPLMGPDALPYRA